MKTKITFLTAILIALYWFSVENDVSPKGVSSIEELVTEVETAFESGNVKDLEHLVYSSDGANADPMNQLHTAFVFTGAGKHKIADSTIEPHDENSIEERNDVESNLPIHSWITIETKGNEGFEGTESTSTLRLPAGVLEGRWYLLE